MMNLHSIRSTAAQLEYVRALQYKLHLPDALLDNHCVSTFAKPFANLSKRECSQLLEQMVAWESLPAEFARAKGQVDLPGFGP